MPYLERPGAKLFFDDTGRGTPVITTHGFLENGSYWGRTGVSTALAGAGFRVIDLDLRGHGRSMPVGDDPGYDVDRVAEDIGALADALALPRFHLVTHATGGMAGLRFAAAHGGRLRSLVASDTSAATFPLDDYCAPAWDDAPFPDGVTVPGAGFMADWLLGHGSLHRVLQALRQNPEGHLLAPYFNRFDPRGDDAARCWQWADEVYAVNHLPHCAAFARAFFADPDPHTAGLRRIACPTLVLVGEHDVQLRRPADQIARCVPGAQLQVLEGLGHMTAIEDPQRTAAALLAFLRQT
jgi:pimeloyl-ACP methyl ester carboxylesterase